MTKWRDAKVWGYFNYQNKFDQHFGITDRQGQLIQSSFYPNKLWSFAKLEDRTSKIKEIQRKNITSLRNKKKIEQQV